MREQAPILPTVNGSADPFGKMDKADMAYALVQLLGLQDLATSFDPNRDIVVNYRGEELVLADQDEIAAEMKGYVQLAITLSLVNVEFGIEQGPFAVSPTLTARFNADETITRAHYALLASRFYTQYLEN
ncbi:hypothetical protein [Salinimonas marina]|uniref:hypothetical protein n=1 Tax=Salinimonas marina TaxID=2785918 RepID=UPI001E422E07|nr:hypothetical protein [Salinimonas marina]